MENGSVECLVSLAPNLFYGVSIAVTILVLSKHKEDILHFSKMVDKDEIAKNDYNLSVSSYVEAEDLCEKVNVVDLNNEIDQIVSKINELREKLVI